ncbi:2517_t:CDS:2 [Ambispora gerdemannii]|uniref:2517_t:CDS:1 n=1 Tax=Ambispora gerdemannii TaxID=144530 RepID=A0A9N8VBN7_9GLOM|nr:2517_t:CDS:2 [Ambispora gerdemannii]
MIKRSKTPQNPRKLILIPPFLQQTLIRKYQEAIDDAYEKGLSLYPHNTILKSALGAEQKVSEIRLREEVVVHLQIVNMLPSWWWRFSGWNCRIS